MQLSEPLVADLDRLLGTAQSEQRMPSVSACVFRDGDVVWQRSLGFADVASGRLATPDDVYRIGSITKTFTAVLIMQSVAEGRIDLDAPLRSYLPEAPVGPTIRMALSHTSGVQREPPGEIWETMKPPSREELIAGLEDADQVLRPGEQWHYSNLVFALLGEVLMRVSGEPYADVLQRRILDPLGLRRTSLTPVDPKASPYFVDPYTDAVHDEADPEVTESTGAAGWLWSNPGDLACWGTFLADGHEAVLAKAELDRMARVQVMVDETRWSLGWGLGLELYRRGERVFAGHGGAMPGFLAGVCIHRPERTGAAVLCNTSTGADPEKLALDLAEAALDELPRAPEPWRPDGGAPDDVAPMLGRWWSEGNELVLSWQGARLRLEVVDGPPGRRVSWLRQEGDDRWRIEEGRELGELLRVVRDDGGAPAKLYVATYPLTRVPTPFAEDASA